MLGVFVPQHHAEHVVVDQFLDALRDASQELFSIQDGGNLAANLIQQGQSIGLLGMRDKKTRGYGVRIAYQRKEREFGGFVHRPGALKVGSNDNWMSDSRLR